MSSLKKKLHLLLDIVVIKGELCSEKYSTNFTEENTFLILYRLSGTLNSFEKRSMYSKNDSTGISL